MGESKMLKSRLFSVVAVGAMVGFAACGGDDTRDADIVTQDTILQHGTEMQRVEVPTTDTAVVRTETTIDTPVRRDPIDL
jgi:hypothetical protein